MAEGVKGALQQQMVYLSSDCRWSRDFLFSAAEAARSTSSAKNTCSGIHPNKNNSGKAAEKE
jgi:hypothetical protein